MRLSFSESGGTHTRPSQRPASRRTTGCEGHSIRELPTPFAGSSLIVETVLLRVGGGGGSGLRDGFIKGGVPMRQRLDEHGENVRYPRQRKNGLVDFGCDLHPVVPRHIGRGGGDRRFVGGGRQSEHSTTVNRALVRCPIGCLWANCVRLARNVPHRDIIQWAPAAANTSYWD